MAEVARDRAGRTCNGGPSNRQQGGSRVAERSGFGSLDALHRVFQKRMGVTPGSAGVVARTASAGA
jgi:hypothetical protein